MEQDEWVVLEVGVEAVKQEVGWVEASTLVMGYSIEDVEKHVAEMVDWEVGEDIEEHKAKKEVWTMSTRVERVHSGWDGNKSKMHLACPARMAKVLEASFDL